MMQNFSKMQRMSSLYRNSLAVRTFYYPGQHHVHLN